MGKMDRDLPGRILVLFRFHLQRSCGGRVWISIFRNDTPDTEFSCDSQGDAANYGSRPKVGELITMPAYAFMTTAITVHKGSIGFPGMRRLMFQFYAAWIMIFDTLGNFSVDCLFHLGRDAAH